MLTPEEFNVILERVRNGTASADDLDRLGRSQPKTGESSTFNIGEVKGEDVQFGDRITIEQILGQKVIYLSVDEIKTREFHQTSPYKGLKKFEPEDKDRFFGRDQFIKDLANELEQTNLILLLGASGSGKSSVVRAGLLSWLSKKWGSRLVSLTFTPDQDPFESLYASLLRYYKQAEAQVAREGREDTLTQIVTTLRQRDAYWFIFIDQFEELFTTSQADKRDRFMTGLAQLNTALKLLGSAQACPVKVMATMRADFLDRLSPYPALVKATNQHRPMIAEMQLDELRQAIEQPAAQQGVVFEMGLVEEIIKDVQGQAGYLPLLQYTLNLVWETEVQNGSIHDRTLNISTYRALGGVRGALQKHVSQIYEALPEAERLAAQRVFLKLVEIGGDEESGTEWKPVRRRAERSELASELEQRVLMQLIDENLLVSDHQPQAQGSTVEIAHEALLTSWETLKSWITEHRRAIALRNRLNDDVAQWQVEKKEDELWSGAKLLRMQELQKDATFNHVLGGFSPAANQFIDASLKRRDRQRRRTIIGLASFSAITLGLAGVAVWQGQRSERLRLTTEADQAGVLALRGFESGRGEIDSLLSAIDAGQKLKALASSNALPESYPTTSPVLALQTILDNIQEKNQFYGHHGRIYGVSFNPDGQHFVTIGEDSAVRLWELNGKNKLLEGHKGEVWDIKFASNGQLFATLGEDATVRLWDLSGHLVREWQVDNVGCHSFLFTPDGQRLITACSKFGMWDLSGKKIDEWKNSNPSAVLSMDISQDGKYLLASGFGSIVQLWDLPLKKLKSKIEFQQPGIPSVSFTSDNQQFITASANGKMQFWDLSGSPVKTPNQQDKIFNNPSTISRMKLSPNGQRIIIASSDGTLRLWSIEGKQLAQFTNQDAVSDASFSPDGQHLVVAGEHGNVILVDLSRQLVHTLNIAGEHDGVVLDRSLDGKYLAIASGGYAQISDLSGTQLSGWIADNNGWFVSSFSFNQDNKALAIASDRFGTVRLWNIELALTKRGWSPDLIKTSCTGQLKYISAMRFSRSGLLAVVSNDGQAKIWNPQNIVPIQAANCVEAPASSDGMIASLDGHEGAVSSIDFSPDEQLVATGGADGTVRIWNTKGQQIQEVKHQESVSTVRFSPDGKLIATGWADGTIRILNIQGQELVRSEGHQEAISSLGFSSNGQVLASGGIDGIVRVWNLSGQQLTHFHTLQGKIQQVSFTSDEKIITSGSDGTVRVWQLGERGSLKQLLSRGCSWLKDYFDTHPEVLKKVTTCQNGAG